jgi:hypothetical protein
VVSWFGRQLDRLRSLNPFAVDAVVAVLFTAVCVSTVFSQEIRDEAGVLREDFTEPSGAAVLTILLTCAPIAFRRRTPFVALVISSLGILTHLFVGWPEGSLPLAPLLLTYSVAAWCSIGTAVAGLAVICVTVILLGLMGAPGLDAVGVLGVIAQFAAVWAIAVALRNRRAATEARVREGTNAPRRSARTPLGLSPRSGCASPRSCTTWSPTRCR